MKTCTASLSNIYSFLTSIQHKRATVAGLLFAMGVATIQTACAQTLVLLPNIKTIAGTGVQGETGSPGTATAATINTPLAGGADVYGNIYFPDLNSSVIHEVTPAGQISTIAGTGAACNPTTACGDGGPATAATFANPADVKVDRFGNIYIADISAARVRKIAAGTGIITTVVGTGTFGIYRSTTPAAGTSTAIGRPIGLAIDVTGNNLYISDSFDSIIYKYVVSTGQVAAFVNSAAAGGFSGDGGQAAAAETNNNLGMTTDAAGNLYIADQFNNRIRVVNAATGVITTLVGTGTAAYTGDGGTAIAATLNSPREVAFDLNNNLIITDSGNTVVRIVYATNGVISTTSNIATLAGTGASCAVSTNPCGDGGLAINAMFKATGGGAGGAALIAFSPATGETIISDNADYRVRTLVPSTVFPSSPVASAVTNTIGLQVANGGLTISSITVATGPNGTAEFTAGTVTGCAVNGTTTNAVGTICSIPTTFQPAYPGNRTAQLKVVTSAGTFYYGLVGTGTSPEAVLSPGTISTIAGTGLAGHNASTTAATAQIGAPRSGVVDSQGNFYFADTTNNIVSEITPAGVISTVAGTAGSACGTSTSACGDGGAATSALLNGPKGLTIDAAGSLFIADTGDNRIRKVSAGTGIITTVAGTGASSFGGDNGLATSATLKAPQGVTIDPTGNLYIADTGNDAIRIINGNSLYIFTYAGIGGTQCSSSTSACGDGGVASAATFSLPSGLAIDPAGNLLVADSGDNRIRKVALSTGLVSTVAGTGAAGGANGTPATSGTLSNPTDVAVDAAGNIYIADTSNNLLRRVDFATGALITISSTSGTACATASAQPSCGDGGLSNAATFNAPAGIALDGAGNLYVSDTNDAEIRKVNVSAASLTFATTPIDNTSSDSPKTEYLQNIGNAPLTLNQPNTGSNPSLSAGFTESNTQTCPQLTSSTGTLAVGAKCSYIVSFAPTTVSTYTGSLVETDNSLNATAATQTVTLNGIATEDNPTIALTTNPNPSTFGAAVTLTGTVSGNGTAPTGTVNFYSVGATQLINLSAAPSSTTTALTLALTAGTYSISLPGTAGGGTYNGWNPAANPTTNGRWTDRYGVQLCASCATNQIVDDQGPGGSEPSFATDTAALAGYQSSPQYATYPGGTEVGNPYIFTLTSPQSVTLSVPDPGSFGDDTGGLSLNVTTLTAIGSGTVNGGVATATTSALPVGTTPIVAVYSGDPNHVTAESAIVNQTVNRGGGLGTDTLTSTNATPTYGSPVTFTDSIPELNGICPAGPATFNYTTSGNTTPVSLGTGTIAPASPATTPATCVATLTTSALPAGTDSVIASFPQDANYAASTSNVLTENVGTVSGANDTLTANPASTTFGSPVTLTFTVPTVAGAGVAPTGTVTFKNGTTTLGTGTLTTTGTGASAVTTATLTTSTLPVGTDTITATYPGDTNYAAATPAPTATETVTPATPVASLTASPSTGDTFGAPVVLTETVTPVNGACPTSTVTFASGGTTLGTATFPAAPTGTPATCTASITTTALPVGTDTVTATAPAAGNFAAISSSTTETVAAASGANDTLTANPTTSTFGSSVTLTFTVPTVAGASGPPTGTVTFTNGATTLGTATLTTTGTGANAVTTATLTTSALPVGTDTVTANYPGNASYAAANPAPTATETVSAVIPTASLTASPASGDTFGAPVVLTETVAPVNGVCPTSTVTFASGGTTLGTATFPAAPTGTPASCTASITTTALPVGTDTVTATAPAAGNFGAISSSTTETVAATSGANDTLTANPTSSTFGSPVTLTFTVPTVAGASAPPTGTVTFTSGGATIGTATLSTTGTGAAAVTTATLSTSTLPVGIDTITANYPGNASYGAASPAPTATETVGQAAPTASLTASPATGDTFGAPVTLTETVTPINGVCPSSTVTFASGGATLGTATFPATATGTPATCTASITTTALPVGTDTVTATAPAAGNFAAISSSTAETVAAASGANDTLTANPTASTFGAAVTLTFTVPTVAGASTAPTGTVTFTSGGVTLGTATLSTTGTGANAVTTATLSTSALPVGTDTITANYPGNASYAAANPAPTATETVGAATPTATLTASPTTGDTFGAPVTLTETVTPVNGVCPTSTVTFASGGTTLGTASFPAAPTGTPATCTASLTTTALPVGTDTVTATAPAAGSFGPISSSTTETVATASGANDTLTANPTSAAFGSPVILTFTVPTVAGASAPPTGTVTFSNGSTTLGTATLTTTGTGANAVTTATLTTTALPVGTDTVTASYPGNASYAAANPAPTATVTIGQGTASATLTASPATGDTFGAPVILTETVTPINGVCPTSTVTFASGGTTLGTANFPASPTGTPAACTATITTTALPVGTDTVTATAPAGGSFGAISSTTSETVGAASGANDTLTANPTSSSFGSPVQLIFTVPTVAGASSSPTGTVTFTSGGVTLGTATLITVGSGANATTTATLATSALPVGTDTITASYPGNTSYAAATPSPTATEVVGQASANGTLSATPSTGDTFGAPVTLTETIAPINGVCPTATVTFASGGTTLGTSTFTGVPAANPTSCTATVTTTALPVGSDTVTATAPAAGSFGAISSQVTEAVGVASGANDTLTANPASSAFGSPVILTFTVPTVGGAGTSPTGTVTFTSGGITLGTATLTTTGTGANAVTTATLTTSALPVGTDTVTATYPGSANYGAASPAPTATETVTQGTSNGNLTVSPATGDTYGSPVILTETVTPINGACPTATVTFTSGGSTLGTATFPATPSGNPAACVATVTTSALPVGTDTITATAPAAGSFGPISSSATETVGVASGSGDTLTANPASSAFGSPVTLTFTIPAMAGASAPATGTVTFSNGATTLGTGTLTTTGGVTTATLTTSALPVGTDTVTASYPGDTNYGPGTAAAAETVNPASSTGTLTASPATGDTFGAPVTLAETITPINGVCPTATVTFASGGTTLGTSGFTAVPAANPTSCVATVTTSALPVGTDTITATAPAAGSFGPISSSTTETVGVASGSGDTLTANPTTSTFASPVTLTFTVPPVAGASAPPTGTVTFSNGATTLGTGTLTTTGGVTTATLTTSALPVGTDTVTASYPGNTNYGSGTATAAETVTTATGSGDTLTANPASSSFGSPVVLTFTVPPVAGASTPPTGTVTFSNGVTTLGTGTLSTIGGVTTATLTTSALQVGTDTVTASYPGDTNYSSGTASTTETVSPASATGTLTASPATGDTFGSPVTLTETVAPINGVCPTATVTFASGGTTLGTSTFTATPAGNPTSCVATLTTSALPAGTDTITATAPAGGSFGPISSSTTETVGAASGLGDTLAANPATSSFGSPVLLTFTVPAVAGAPAPASGTVTFTNGATTLGTGTLSTTGGVTTATLTTSALPVGTDTVTATYAGNGSYGPASPTATETVSAAAANGTLTASPATGDTFGSPVTLTETIAPINGVCPTATVTFANGTTTLGTGTFTPVPATGTPTSCVATTTTSALPVGTDTITATAPAAGNFGPISSSTTETVGLAVSTGVLTVQTAPGSGYGSPATLTETVLPVNGVCPTGIVTFTDGGATLGTGTFTNVPATGTPTSCTATATTTALPAGTSTVTATYPGNGVFGPITSTTTVTIAAASGSADTLSATPASPVIGTTVTLTFTVPPVAGATVPPTGTVTFTFGATTLGTASITTVNGVSTATITTTTLPLGADTVTATYAGNGSYGASAPTTVVNVLPNDFAIAATPPTQTVNPGDAATYTISLSGVQVPFNSPVTLTATGLPPGATVTFANPTYVPGAGPTNTTMTIVTSQTQALLKPAKGGNANGVYYGLLLLPLLGVRRIRKKLRALPKGLSYCLAAMLLLGGLGTMTGCTGGGYFGPSPQTFTITVTGTSGSLVHSTTVTLTVR